MKGSETTRQNLIRPIIKSGLHRELSLGTWIFGNVERSNDSLERSISRQKTPGVHSSFAKWLSDFENNLFVTTVTSPETKSLQHRFFNRKLQSVNIIGYSFVSQSRGFLSLTPWQSEES